MGYTFRAKPKFFDVVKWTGDGTLNRQISHNLQSIPYFMIIKRIDDINNLQYPMFDSLFIINQSPSTASFKYKLYPEMEGSHTTFGQQGVWYSDLPSDPGNVGAQTNLGVYSNQTFWLKYNMGNGTNVIMPTTSNFTVGHSASHASGFTNENNGEYICLLYTSPSPRDRG